MTASEHADLTAWPTQQRGVATWPRRWRVAFSRPLPHLADQPLTRWLCRVLVATLGNRVERIEGLEHLQAARGPFILCLNHSTRTEALILPALLMFYRDGRPVRFLADWNFMLYPGLGLLMRRARVIPVGRKPAKPRFLNLLKRWYVPTGSAVERAEAVLRDGGAVGIFPEGTVNRNPRELLPGCLGAARLSQQTGAPIIPAGIRHPHHDGQRPVAGRDTMHLFIGEPLCPGNGRSRAALHEQHARLMTAISTLCGKPWQLIHP